ncbi:hypothetical protein CBFG_01608 [Clostridiales bacterium 1_7_47FAA]|nr:hypothetical protein CBFG_01608 [Clostridiales bacterium 1_7_47FAA]
MDSIVIYIKDLRPLHRGRISILHPLSIQFISNKKGLSALIPLIVLLYPVSVSVQPRNTPH